MSIGTLLKTTKGKIITVAGGTVVAVGIGVAVLLQGGGYRSIAVEKVAGTVNVVGEINNGQAYQGEHLYSGDDVTVMDASEIVMCMDNDKYVYADANTHFKLEASDRSEDSRIKIYLDAGSELNELQNKLESGETYEVDTPNSTMSVRGTSFRVTVYKAPDGLIYTLTEVTTGEVLVRLKTTDGSYNGVEKLFTPGQSALIRGNSEFSEFVSSGLLDANDIENSGDDDALELAYGSLPEDGMERLIALLENGNIIENDEETETKEEVKDTKKEEVKKEEAEKKEEVEEDTSEEETDEEDTEEEEDNRTPFQKLADAATASRNDDGTINLKDGTLFDPDYYARNNPDVVEEFGRSDEDLLAHYLIFGKNEDRSPSEKAEQEKQNAWIALMKELAATNVEEEETEEEEDNTVAAINNTPAFFKKATVAAGYFNPTNINNGTAASAFNATTTGGTPVTITSKASNLSRMAINGYTPVSLPTYFSEVGGQETLAVENPKRIAWDTSVSGASVTYTYTDPNNPTNHSDYTVKKTGTDSYTISESVNNGPTTTTSYSDYNSFASDLGRIPG